MRMHGDILRTCMYFVPHRYSGGTDVSSGSRLGRSRHLGKRPGQEAKLGYGVGEGHWGLGIGSNTTTCSASPRTCLSSTTLLYGVAATCETAHLLSTRGEVASIPYLH